MASPRSNAQSSRPSSGMRSLAAETAATAAEEKAANDFLEAFDDTDPLEKIKKWKPAVPYFTMVEETQADRIIGKKWEEPWKGKAIPDGVYWRKLKRERESSPPPAEEPFRDYLHFERTPDDARLIEFLLGELSSHSLQLQDFRIFPYATEGVKNREIFDPEVGKMPMRKKMRMCWKLAAQTGLRGPQDILQLTDKDWVRGHMPLPFAFIKKEMLNHYYTQLSDVERAALWMSVGETVRHIDHQRVLDFPVKETPLPTEQDDDPTPRAPEYKLKRYQNKPPQHYAGLYNHILKKEVKEWQVKAARDKLADEM